MLAVLKAEINEKDRSRSSPAGVVGQGSDSTDKGTACRRAGFAGKGSPCLRSDRKHASPETHYDRRISATCDSARQQSRSVLLRRSRLSYLPALARTGGAHVSGGRSRLRAHDEPCAPAGHPWIGGRRLQDDAIPGAALRTVHQQDPSPQRNTMG